MTGIFDLFSPDPRMRIAAAFNQAPGQVGSNTGPMPIGGPAAAPGAAPSGAPSPTPPMGGGAPGADPGAPGGGAGPGGPGGGAAAASAPAPQAQAYTSPPDLIGMYAQLAQRQQANEGFNRGIGMLAAAFAQPRDRALMMNAMSGQSGNADDFMRNVIGLQQFNQQQMLFNQQIARYNDLITNSDKYAKAYGIDPDMFKATISAAGPQGAGEVLGKIAEAQMGITGTQTDKEYRQAVRNFRAANPDKDLPPELQTEAGFAAQQAATVTAGNQQAKDLIADQHNFAPALTNYDKAISMIDQFNTPRMQAGAKEFLGTAGQYRPLATMSADGKAAYALYKQIMASQFAAGTQDFKGAGRITQQELNQDAPSQSTMGQLNQDPSDFFAGVAKYRDQLAEHRAHLFGAAQMTNDPRLSDADYAKHVAPNIDVTGGARRPNDFTKMSDSQADAAVAKLPPGSVFVGPDGNLHKKN